MEVKHGCRIIGGVGGEENGEKGRDRKGRRLGRKGRGRSCVVIWRKAELKNERE